MNLRPFLLCLITSAGCLRAAAQSYSIDWYKVAGGGGTSTGGVFSATGTIGQPDAGSAMGGGSYSLTGGFWSLASVVQTPGAPTLLLLRNPANSLTILWPATGTYTLQQSANLTPASWTPTSYSIHTANGTNSITLTTLPPGSLFFRLSNP